MFFYPNCDFSVQWGVPTVSAAGVFGDYDDVDNDIFSSFTLDNKKKDYLEFLVPWTHKELTLKADKNPINNEKLNYKMINQTMVNCF